MDKPIAPVIMDSIKYLLDVINDASYEIELELPPYEIASIIDEIADNDRTREVIDEAIDDYMDVLADESQYGYQDEI